MATCPYCKDDVDGRNVIQCPSCTTLHHKECWESNEELCSVYGCHSKDGLLSGCPWCDEVYFHREHTNCMNCGSPLMTASEYSNFIRGTDWVRLNLDGSDNAYLTHGYLRNQGIVARLEKTPAIYGYFQMQPYLWVMISDLDRARELLKDLSESLLYCEECGHVLGDEEAECSYCDVDALRET